ncbi:MAG: hypothetical protein ABI883_02150 [Chthoniobacterales bacterium]
MKPEWVVLLLGFRVRRDKIQIEGLPTRNPYARESRLRRRDLNQGLAIIRPARPEVGSNARVFACFQYAHWADPAPTSP